MVRLFRFSRMVQRPIYLDIRMYECLKEDRDVIDPVPMLRAIADQTRLRILTLLSRRELCVCQLVEVLGEGQSKVSRHLAHLRNAGLVNDRRKGLWVYYSLSEPESQLHRLLGQWLPVA